MRLLLGVILACILTVGGSYLYDNHNAIAAPDAGSGAQRPLVNWYVVGHKWGRLTDRARSEWARPAS